jgi:hypothetical protein
MTELDGRKRSIRVDVIVQAPKMAQINLGQHPCLPVKLPTPDPEIILPQSHR